MPNIQYTNTSPIILPQEKDGIPINLKQIGAKTIKYCLYARKSSEDDERQALSIDSQIKEMAVQAQSQGLLVTEIRRESHSAKNSAQRPVFNGLIADIQKGEFNGILSWAPDRLSRNAGDLGTLVDLMDRGYLTEIKTHGQTFTNTPNDKFLLMILCSQAKLENDNRGINVKRGFKTKCELGFRPNMAPLGYINDHYSGKGMKKVFIDKERAPIIKQMFEKVAYEKYSGRDVYEWLKNETNLRSRHGNLLNLSVIYRILNNTYYCGLFEFSGKWYKGSHEPIITRELFDAVQKKMTVAPKSKPGTKQFDFTKLFKCGSCDSGISAQEKFKRYKSGKIVRYVYYHCTQFKDFDCKEPYIREEKLVEQLIYLLKDIPIEKIQNTISLKPDLDKFMVIKSALNSQSEINIQEFIRYIFNQGTKDQKKDLIGCLEREIYLKDRQIYVNQQIKLDE